MSTRQIADAIGIGVSTVTALEIGSARPISVNPSEERGRSVVFPIEVLNALGPHAAKRGIHPNSLARRIVEIAIKEKMVDAILDDADDRRGGSR